MEPEPEELPPVGAWVPVAGRAPCRKSPQCEPKNSGDVVHIGGYHGGFAAAWVTQVLK